MSCHFHFLGEEGPLSFKRSQRWRAQSVPSRPGQQKQTTIFKLEQTSEWIWRRVSRPQKKQGFRQRRQRRGGGEEK